LAGYFGKCGADFLLLISRRRTDVEHIHLHLRLLRNHTDRPDETGQKQNSGREHDEDFNISVGKLLFCASSRSLAK